MHRHRRGTYPPQCHCDLHVYRTDVERGEYIAGGIFKDAATIAGTEGQLFVFFIMVVAAAEVTVGLAIIVMMYRNIHSVDINFLNRLKH